MKKKIMKAMAVFLALIMMGGMLPGTGFLSQKAYAVVEAPTVLPTSGFFQDSDEDENEIGGTISWTAASPTDYIDGYKVYWGSDTSTKLAGNDGVVYTVEGASSTSQTVAENTALPAGATHFLIYSYNARDNSATCLAVNINDVAPVVAPTLSVTIGPGSAGGATKAVITGTPDHSFKINITDSAVPVPNAGDPIPFPLVVNNYTSGDNIADDSVAAGKYIQVYDGTVTGYVVKFYQQQLTADDIGDGSTPPAPTVLPAGGSFTDTDTDADEIGGNLSWTAASPTDGIDGYKIYWGSDITTKLAGNDGVVYTVEGASGTSQTVAENTALPAGATHFLIYSYNAGGNSENCLAVAITDDTGAPPGDEDYGLTFSGGSFKVNGAGEYASLAAALAACTEAGGDGELVIKLGDAGSPLMLPQADRHSPANNQLLTATYTGNIQIQNEDVSHRLGLFIPNGVTATLRDLVLTQTGTAGSVFNMVEVDAGGILNIEEGTSLTVGNSDDKGVYNDGGTVNITGGTLSATGDWAQAIHNYDNGTVNISGGTISASGTDTTYTPTPIYNRSTLSVSGTATLSGVRYGVYNYGNDANMEISGGTIEATGAGENALYTAGTGTINMTGGTIRATDTGDGNSHGIYNSNSIINISGGTVSCAGQGTSNAAAILLGGTATANVNICGTATITGVKYGIYNSGTKTSDNGAVYIIGGTVTATGAGGSGGLAINNQRTGLVTIAGGTVEVAGSGATAVNNNDKGIITITGGTVQATNSTDNANYALTVPYGGTVNISGGTVFSAGTGSSAAAIRLNNPPAGAITVSTANIAGTPRIISASGNTVKLSKNSSFADAEKCVVFGKAFYSDTLADIIITGATVDGKKEINSTNYGDATVTASSITFGKSFIGWMSDSARTVSISTTNGADIASLTTGGNDGVTDIYLKAGEPLPVPTVLPTNGAFTDTDTDAEEIGGTISWTAASPTDGIDGYKIYWGSNETTVLAGNTDVVYTVAGVGTESQEVTADMALPAGATHFLIYSYNSGGNSTNCLAVTITDDTSWGPVSDSGFIDGDGENGLNKNPATVAWYPQITELNGSLYVAWEEGTPNQIRVAKFNGTNWSFIDGNHDTNGLNYNNAENAKTPDIATYNGKIYVIWKEKNFPSQIRIKAYDGISWTTFDALNYLPLEEERSSTNPQLTVHNNELYASWAEYDANYETQIRVKKYDGTSWTFVDGNGVAGLNKASLCSADSPQLVSDGTDLYATWVEYDAAYNNQVRVKKYNGTSWEFIDGDGDAGINKLSTNSASDPSITVSNGNIYVAWEENNQIRVKKYDGTSWEFVDGGGATGLNYNVSSEYTAGVSLVTVNNVLYAFWNENTGLKAQLRAKKYDGTSWTFVDGGGANGLNKDNGQSALFPEAIVVNGEIYLVWYEENDGNGNYQIRVKKHEDLFSYNVTYNGNGSTGGTVPTDSNKYVQGATVTVLDNTGNLERTGYNFAGWNTTADGSGTDYAVGATFTMEDADTILYAKWTAVETGNNDGSYPSVDSSNNMPITVDGQTQQQGATVLTQTRNGTTVTTATLDTDKLTERVNQGQNGSRITVPIAGNPDVAVGELNGQLVKAMESKQAVVEVKTQSETYTLPAQEINIDAVSAQLGQDVDLSDIKVNIEIAKTSQETVKVVEDTAAKGNFSIVVPPVDFSVKCTYGDKTVEVSQFNSYVERTVAIPGGVDPSKITTAIVVDVDGTVRHVPTTIVIIDGKYHAKINSLTNSTYSVIWNPVKFKDVETHWAKDTLNDMGSRMVIIGDSNDMVHPDEQINRAEFAMVIVKALGLKPDSGNSIYEDIKNTDNYCGHINTATQYKIVAGYGNGIFGPSDRITREQAMSMTARAMDITGLKAEFAPGERERLLAHFIDADKVEDYAESSVAACIKTGVIVGKGMNTIAPKDYITRAELAAVIQRLLQKSKLI